MDITACRRAVFIAGNIADMLLAWPADQPGPSAVEVHDAGQGPLIPIFFSMEPPGDAVGGAPGTCRRRWDEFRADRMARCRGCRRRIGRRARTRWMMFSGGHSPAEMKILVPEQLQDRRYR